MSLFPALKLGILFKMLINNVIDKFCAIVYISVLTYSVSSCKHDSSSELIIFKREDFAENAFLKGDTICFDKALNPLSYYILRDTILLVVNKSHPEYLVELYNLKSNELIVKTVKTGRGPGEFLSCQVYYNNNEDKFIVSDMVAKVMAVFNIDTLLAEESYNPVRNKLPDYVKEATFLDSSNIIGFNIWYLEGYNKADNLIVVNKTDQHSLPHYNNKSNYEVVNVTGAYLVVSPKDKTILVPYHYDDRIEIYKDDLNLIKTLKGPDNFHIGYEFQNRNRIAFKDRKYYRAYFPYYYTDNSIYIIYVGINGLDPGINHRKPVEVFKLGWNGELLCRYQLDNYIFNISVDKEEKFLYGSHLNSFDEYPLLLRYKLK